MSCHWLIEKLLDREKYNYYDTLRDIDRTLKEHDKLKAYLEKRYTMPKLEDEEND